MPRALAPGSGAFVALIAALMTVTAMSIDINLPAIPAIVATLGTELTLAQLTVTTFFVGFAFGQVLWGPLSDRYGRRPALFGGMLVYVGASVGCALSPDIGWLLGLRVVQGLGAGAGPVVGRAIVRDLFEGPTMARVMSLVMTAFILAPLIAPTIGAALLAVTGWRGIFLFLTAYGLVITLLGAVTLGESLKRPDPQALRFGRLTAAFTAMFLSSASRRPAIATTFVYSTLTIYLANASAIFMDGYGFSAQTFGLVFASIALCSAAGSLTNARLVRHFAMARIIRAALIAGCLIAAAMLALEAVGVGGYPGLIVGYGALFLCFGFVTSNGMTLALAPHGHIAGAAAAALGFTQAIVPAAIASLVAAFFDGTARPSLLATLVLFLLGLLVFGTGREPVSATRRPAVTP